MLGDSVAYEICRPFYYVPWSGWTSKIPFAGKVAPGKEDTCRRLVMQ